MISSKTVHTLTCDLCPRKTSSTDGTPEQTREKAAKRGWETRPAPEPGSPDLDVCPPCAKQNPRQEVREVLIGKGRPRKRRPFGRQPGGWSPPAAPATPPPPAGPKTT